MSDSTACETHRSEFERLLLEHAWTYALLHVIGL